MNGISWINVTYIYNMQVHALSIIDMETGYNRVQLTALTLRILHVQADIVQHKHTNVSFCFWEAHTTLT